MQVFVLEGFNCNGNQGSMVLGVYMTRKSADLAAIEYNSQAEDRYDLYLVHKITTSTPARDYEEGSVVELD